jgi:hypothetical protein
MLMITCEAAYLPEVHDRHLQVARMIVQISHTSQVHLTDSWHLLARK